MTDYDAIIIGSGPNGLSAAIRLAQEGLSVLVLEGRATIGGGTRSGELTLPGFIHDICSTIHPLGLASPFLRSLPLQDHGLAWIQPDAPLAHVMDDSAVLIEKDLDVTADGLGSDARSYRRLMKSLVRNWEGIMFDFLGPLPLPPRHPVAVTQFGLQAIRSATGLAKGVFRGERARAAFAGMAGHSMMPLEWPATASFGLMLGILAHATGWPVAKGGSQQIANAMASYFRSLGGKIETGQMVLKWSELPAARAVLFDTAPAGVIKIAGQHLNARYRDQLNKYRYGPGVCKVDWALDGPIPWKSPEAARAATVHVGGTMEEIALAESMAWKGKHTDKPFVLLAQQSLFDCSRAPEGKHTAWAYCHVPNGSKKDVSAVIEAQVERFAPGFKDCIIGRHVNTAVQMEAYNPNYVGGDVNTGVQNLRQLFTRPAVKWNPYRVPGDFGAMSAYICSSATPPGGGVHGMCGFHAAETVLRDL